MGMGDATPITPAEDQLLDDQVVTGAETPSRVVAESLSQMSMGSPAASLVAGGPPMKVRMPKEESPAPTNCYPHWPFIIFRVVLTLYGGRCSLLLLDSRRKEERRKEEQNQAQ